MTTLTLTEEERIWLDSLLKSNYRLSERDKKTVSPYYHWIYNETMERTTDFGVKHLGWEDWHSFLQFCQTGRYPE